MEKINRRSFLKAAGAAAVSASAVAEAHAAKTKNETSHHAAANGPQASQNNPQNYTFFNTEEAAFIESAIDRLIPSDDVGPGAIDAGVQFFLDKQLGGAWGAGERLYRSGPWKEGAPTQGYQLPYTPAELFKTALRGIKQDLATRNTTFSMLKPEEQDAYLSALENGEVKIDSVPSKVFFESLWSLTLEGYFSDPVYGGNKDMVAWRMIGFPGAYANFYHLVDQHGMDYNRAPISQADNGRGVIHIHPNIPAKIGNATQGGK